MKNQKYLLWNDESGASVEEGAGVEDSRSLFYTCSLFYTGLFYTGLFYTGNLPLTLLWKSNSGVEEENVFYTGSSTPARAR